MSIAEILNGKDDDYTGLIPLCYTYLDFIGADSVTYDKLSRYMEFIRARAEGRVMTAAAWMRKFVLEHPCYAKDSRVPPAAAYDLMVAVTDIGEGRRQCAELLGDYAVQPEVRPARSLENHTRISRQITTGRLPLLTRFWERAKQKREAALDAKIAAKQSEMDAMQTQLRQLQNEKKAALER